MIEAIKCLIFISILFYASYCDIKTREVPDFIHLMILITGFIGITNENIPSMIIGFLIIPLPLFFSAVFKEKSIGGADIKFMAACSFLLGFERGLVAMVVGLLLAVIYTVIFNKIRRKSIAETFPLVPYLAVGNFIVYYIWHLAFIMKYDII
jgi:leader peptidase (prepilin peptidase)/N-methyltransferase